MLYPYLEVLEGFRTYLHEEALDQGFSDIDVVVFRWEICAGSFEIESVHYPWQLLTHIIGLL